MVNVYKSVGIITIFSDWSDTISASAQWKTARILIVEDERHIARYLKFVLEREGYEVAIAHDGETALQEILASKPDAVLLDLVLPGMSGLDVVAGIRADDRFQDLVVIVLSARSSPEDHVFLAVANVQAQCPKPVAPSTLLKKLNEFGIRPTLPV